MKHGLLGGVFLAGLMLPLANAQVLRQQPTPFSVWLDFRTLSTGAPSRVALPIWLESVQTESVPGEKARPGRTIFRLYFRPLYHLNSYVHLRLFFDDQPGHEPSVTGWTETGDLRFEGRPLGAGVGLPTSEALLVPMRDINYLEIEAPGNGNGLRGAFLTTLKKAETHHALDFATSSEVQDPFDNLPSTSNGDDDSYLFGRVRATLERGVARLTPGEPPLTYEFELDTRPLVAVLTFEILDVDPLYPPEATINGRPLGAISVHLPDLADPGFEGAVLPLEPDMRFRYAGWLRCQKIIRGSALEAGLNRLVVQSNSHSGAVAIRAVDIQLKHNWQNLHYKLVP